MSKAEILSYGGGVQSVATVLLIADGVLPKPDMVVFADTGREVSTTLEYAERYTFPLLQRLGVPVHVVKASQFGQDMLWWGDSILIPAFERTGTGTRQLRNLCSYKWKRRTIQHFLRSRGVRSCRVWLCISVDEWTRAKDSREQWYQHWYPLLEMRISRKQCIRFIQAHGWPIPAKSRCWCCPYQSKREWLSLQGTPDWDKAVKMEQQIRQHGYYLTSACSPLEDQTAESLQLELPVTEGVCDGGTCFL